MLPTGLQYQLRDAAHARLYASEKLAAGLLDNRDPAFQRIILQEILDNGQKTLDQMAHRGDPYLMASTYLFMAEASFDLSAITSYSLEKENLLHRTLDFADLAAGSALESEHMAVPLVLLPELLTVLTRLLAAVSVAPGQPLNPQQRLVQNRIRGAVRALVDCEERQRQDRRQVAQDLYVVQTLAASADWVESQPDQKKVLEKAQELVQQVLTRARGAGDRDLTGQAQRMVDEIERRMKA